MKTTLDKNSESHPQVNNRGKVDPYRRIARIYDRIFEPLNRGLRAIGKRMFPPFKGMTVLDVGCGTGVHLELYQKAGCEVYGIDQSPSMLQVAQERLSESAHLHMGDAAKMPYSDRTFELIIMFTVLHEMSDEVRSAVITESKRVLKKEGRILFIDYYPGPIRPLKGWLYKGIIMLAEVLAGREHYKNYRNFMANDGLMGLIASHGLIMDQKRIVSGGNIALLLLRSQ